MTSGTSCALLLHSFDHVCNHEMENSLPGDAVFSRELVIQQFLHGVHDSSLHNREVVSVNAVVHMPLAKVDQISDKDVQIRSKQAHCHLDHLYHSSCVDMKARITPEIFVFGELKHCAGLWRELKDTLEDEFAGSIM